MAVNMAGAGQIGGITEDYSRWQEVAGLPAANLNFWVVDRKTID